MDKQNSSPRRPSGFGTTGQSRKVQPQHTPKPKKETNAKPEKPAKEKRVRKERDPGKNRPILRILLALVFAAILVCVLMVIIFGGEDTTYHQMPTIERESISHFEPEMTPIPVTEGL